VLPISLKNRFVLPNGSGRGGVHTQARSASEGECVAHQHAPWDTFERLIQELNSCDRSVHQVRLALEAVRDTINADAVYWCSTSPREGPEVVGNQALPPEWCHQFVQRLLAETPGVDGQLLRSSLPASSNRTIPSPRSAALVRLSKSRSSWIVALSFHPEHRFGLTDIKVMSLVRRLVLNQRRHAEVSGKLKETVSSLVHCLTAVIETKVRHLRGHSERVAQMAARLGQQMQLPVELVSDSYFAGLLHDIGTVSLPEAVLLKAGQLTDEEIAQVRKCPVVGDHILAGIRPLERLRPAVRHHHERCDGLGYPDRLAGEDIPLLARILSVAESCDAMMSARPYRPPLGARQVEALLAEGAGKQWDPGVVEHFMACRADLYAIGGQANGNSVVPALEQAIGTWSVGSSGDGLQAQHTVTAACQETLRTRKG
jgi:HD-GYP domain-containing protein (c-di-GMP phosphodiesterase class II)